MKQNLAWASVYNILAIPIAAGILYPALRDRAASRVVRAADERSRRSSSPSMPCC